MTMMMTMMMKTCVFCLAAGDDDDGDDDDDEGVDGGANDDSDRGDGGGGDGGDGGGVARPQQLMSIGSSSAMAGLPLFAQAHRSSDAAGDLDRLLGGHLYVLRTNEQRPQGHQP